MLKLKQIMRLLTIDGSQGEGGGQILRTALALSVLTKTPIKIFNIRAKRPNPGLANQHLKVVESFLKLTENSKVFGAKIGSKTLEFYSEKIISKENVEIKVETAASQTLMLQGLLPVLLLKPTPTKLRIKGGATDTFFSPTLYHTKEVLFYFLKKMGAKLELKEIKSGFYPKGGGEIEVQVFPSKLKPLNILSRGKLKKVRLISKASKDLVSRKVAERQAISATQILEKANLKLSEKKIIYVNSLSPGSSLLILAEFENTILAQDKLGEKGKKAEEVGKECAKEFLQQLNSPATVDKYVSDQLLIYLALAKGGSFKIAKPTSHFLTNLKIIKEFNLANFVLEDNVLTCL